MRRSNGVWQLLTGRGAPCLAASALLLAAATHAPLACGGANDNVAEPPMARPELSMPPPLPADTELRRDERTGTVRSLRAADFSAELREDPEYRRLVEAGRLGDAALAFVSHYRGLFRLDDPAHELNVESARTDELGKTHVRLQQSFRGIPVHGGELLVHLEGGAVYLAQGRYVPTPSTLDVTPTLSRDDALDAAARALEADEARSRFRAELAIFGDDDGRARLAYRVVAPVSPLEGWKLMIAADSGEILSRSPTVYPGSRSPQRKQ